MKINNIPAHVADCLTFLKMCQEILTENVKLTKLGDCTGQLPVRCSPVKRCMRPEWGNLTQSQQGGLAAALPTPPQTLHVSQVSLWLHSSLQRLSFSTAQKSLFLYILLFLNHWVHRTELLQHFLSLQQLQINILQEWKWLPLIRRLFPVQIYLSSKDNSDPGPDRGLLLLLLDSHSNTFPFDLHWSTAEECWY